VNNIIRDLREGRGWSQAELAKRLGAARQTVYALESGKTVPGLLLALRVAWQFEKPVEEIFTVELEEKMALCQASWEHSDRLATAIDEVGVLDRMGPDGWELVGFGPMRLHFRRPEEPGLRVEWEHKRLGGPMIGRQRRALEAEGWTFCGSWMGIWHYFKRPVAGVQKPRGAEGGGVPAE
jgi:DNA-binding XRE family transcriptional regulator